jgi:hypothetical protein
MHVTHAAGLGICLASALAAGAASAATWPTNIVGSYSGQANTATIQINVASQASGTPCVAIGGTLVDIGQGLSNPIVGYYCPKSGAIAFVRNDPTTGETFQVFHGSFAETGKRQSNKLAGAFGEYDAIGNLGEYPFTVSR